MINTKASLKEEESAWLDKASASERIQWGLERFGEKVVLSTSFGIQSAVMLHLVTQIRPEIPIIFVDTGHLFPETYRFAEDLTEQMQLNLKVYNPLWTAARQEAIYGKRWEKGLEELEAYNRDNKVEPMNRALKDLGAEAWISGLRRVQSSTRSHLAVVQRQKRTTKIHPIIDWSEKQVYAYMKANDLPFHPLWEKGYVSVGDWHSTVPLETGMQAESTRFGGLKRECGLHEKSDQQDWQI